MVASKVSTRAVVEQLNERAVEYLEVVRVPPMSVGVFALPKGGVDRQTPHAEDEIYYAIRGRARFRAGGKEMGVGPGDVLFVPAREEHRFHDIEEALELLVVFAPAESSGDNLEFREKGKG